MDENPLRTKRAECLVTMPTFLWFAIMPICTTAEKLDFAERVFAAQQQRTLPSSNLFASELDKV